MNNPQQLLWQEATPEILMLDNLASEPDKSAIGAYWATVQLLNHVFATSSCYDPATGQSTAQSLHQALKDLSKCMDIGGRPLPEDNFYRTVEFCLEALEKIFQTPRKKLLRQHEIMPLYKIREMDSQCMAYLAKQPGRNAREKIAIKERALGVQREISANTLENQIVKRFLLDIKPMLTQRIALGNRYDDSEANHHKLRTLERVHNLGTDVLRNSWLKDVTPATILKANNVLLSDRIYNRIWRAVQWFHKHRTEITQIWNSGQQRLLLATYWLILARLWNRTTPIFEDSLCLLHPGFSQEEFGIEILQNDTTTEWQNWMNPYLTLLIPWDYNCYFLNIACQEGKIILETNRMEYSNRPGMEVWEYGRKEPMQHEIQIKLEPNELKEPGRYCPCSITVSRNGKEVMDGIDFADLTGLKQFADELWEFVFRVQRRDFYRCEQSPHNIEPSSISCLGLDLSGAQPRIFSDGRFETPNIYTYAIPFELPDKTMEWQIGHQTPLLLDKKYFSKIISFSSIFEEQDSNSDEKLCTIGLQRIALGISKKLSLSTHVQLAVAIPDTLDELAFQLARTTLTPICDKLYFIWRSVAGALGWQTTKDFENTQIQSGDVVLIMDAEAPVWTTTCLLAKYDRRLENTSACGIYWERKPSLVTLKEGEGLNYHGLLRDYLKQAFRAQGLFNENNNPEENANTLYNNFFPENLEPDLLEEKLEEIIEKLIATGLAERLVETESPIWIALPTELVQYFHNKESTEPSDATWIKIYFDRELWKQATQVWYVRFKDWLYNWKFSEQLQDIKQYAGNKAIHILCVGRPFHKKWLRETIEYYLNNHFDALESKHHILEESEEIISKGACSFLERVDNGLPTYEDWLPDLYLQVLDNGIPNYIQIFEGRTARPGQEIFYDVPNTLELPANQPAYRIPLVRDKNSRRPLLYAARLESPVFPLKQPITVSMQVWYRYGEDSYRLIVKPQDSKMSILKEIEVKWVRGAEHSRESSRQRNNLAPNFPPKEPWDKYELQQYSQWFLEAATDLQREAKQIFSLSFFRFHRLEYVGRYLENFSRLLEKKLLPPCKRLLHYNKEYSEISDEVFFALREKVIPWLIRLAGLESNNLQEVLEELPTSNISVTLQRIQQVSLEVLSLLGPETPKIFLEYLLQKFSDPTKDREVCYMFGRVIGSGKDDRHDLVTTIIQELRKRFEDNNNYSNDRPKSKVGYRYLLWALATALWRHPDFVHTLREHNFIRYLLKIIQHDCHSLLYTLQKASLTPKYQINYLSYFRSIAEILLALLRLREEEGHYFLQAGNRRMIELAFFLHEIDALFLKANYECKSCFKFECVQKHEGMSEIIHVVTSYLSGEEYSGLIKIKKIEDTPDEF